MWSRETEQTRAVLCGPSLCGGGGLTPALFFPGGSWGTWGKRRAGRGYGELGTAGCRQDLQSSPARTPCGGLPTQP